MGIDDNRNGRLDPAEVDASEYVCNGTPGAVSLVRTSPVPPGADCVAGGVSIEAGVDSDRDGLLDPSEVTTRQRVCNGVTLPTPSAPAPTPLEFVEGIATATGQLGAGDYLAASGGHADFYSFATTLAGTTSLTATSGNAATDLFVFTSACAGSPSVAEWGPCYVGRLPSPGGNTLSLGAGSYVLMILDDGGTPWATYAYALRVALSAPAPVPPCGLQTPTVSAIPASCSAQAGAQVTVPIHVCPRCDQATPTCLVHAENAAAGQITLEPVSEVCSPNPSCPIIDPASCAFATIDCAFMAPSPGSVNVTVVTPGAPGSFTLTVTAAGGSPPPVICPL